MNDQTPAPSSAPHPADQVSSRVSARGAYSARAVVAFVLAALLLMLAFAMPALAATLTPHVEQGTVPPPPPITPDDRDSNDDDDDAPMATSTPQPFGEMAVAQVNLQVPPDGTPAAYTGVVLSPRLNVRSGPGTTFGSLGQHLQNESVTVQFRDASGDWWYTCCISGTTTSGWSSAAFIRTDFSTAEGLSLLPLFPNLNALPASAPATSASQQATPRPANGTLSAVVDAQPRLIVRDTAGTNGTILGRISDGATVEIIARNEAGDWWYVCCIDGTQTEGWANAAFLVPNFDAASASTLIPLFGETSLQLPSPTPRATSLAPSLPVITKMPKLLSLARSTPTPLSVVVPTVAVPTVDNPTVVSTPTPTVVAVATDIAPMTTDLPDEEPTPLSAAPTSLEAIAWQEPAFAAPGDTVLLRYLITNTGAGIAREVHVRNELPAGLLLDRGAGSPTAHFERLSTDAGATVFSLMWDAVPAGESVSATVAVTLAPSLAPGSVMYNLAAIGALNAAAQTATITVSTPPAGLPTFQ